MSKGDYVIKVICTDRETHTAVKFGELVWMPGLGWDWHQPKDKRTGAGTLVAARGYGGRPARLDLHCRRCGRQRGEPQWSTVERWAEQLKSAKVTTLDVSHAQILARLC